MKKCLIVNPGDNIKENIKIGEFDESNFLKEMYRIIGCDIIELPVYDKGWALVADEEGLLKGSEINRYFSPKAFELVGNQFAGTLVFINPGDTMDGGDSYEDISDDAVCEILSRSNVWYSKELADSLLDLSSEGKKNESDKDNNSAEEL